MGQYYRIYAEQKDGTAKVFSSYDYGNGAKLMEHSYYGNSFVQAICATILNNPHRVWWVGDYADEPDDFEEDCKYVYAEAWKAEECEKTEEKFDFHAPLYLIDHTEEIYIDLQACRELNEDRWGFAIHPLPLLTAVGNGRGGGDYHGINMDYVGFLAGDLFEISDEVPDGYMDMTEYGVFAER